MGWNVRKSLVALIIKILDRYASDVNANRKTGKYEQAQVDKNDRVLMNHGKEIQTKDWISNKR